MQAQQVVEKKGGGKKDGKKVRGMKDHVMDLSWRGKFVRVKLIDGSEVSGKLEKIAKFEIQVNKLVIFKHSILWVEPVSG